jgi:MYXO-CTERM domain-containing protein
MTGVWLSLLISSASAQTFSRPVTCDDCIAGWYYFDRNGADAGREDWNCGTSTYDGHRGSDFSLRGGNPAIDTGYDIIAVADGEVVSTEDGHFDHCSTCDAAVDSRCGTAFGFGFANHVVVNHGSYRVVYAHMRTGSVRVGPGDTVRCGDVLGQIGSSGCSTGAHLHFEPRPLGGGTYTAFDPYEGMCSATSPSRWTVQGPYRGMPDRVCGPAVPTCPSGTYPIWTCNAGRTERRRCIEGIDMTEPCPYGCVVMPVGTDDVCMEAPDGDGDGHRADVDCDDGNPARHPGATETCSDGIDQDCDGGDLVCPGTDAGPTTRDAGEQTTDATVPGIDGSRPGRDSGRRDGAIDPGSGIGGGAVTGGCGCAATSGGSMPFALVIIAFGAWMHRRRR